MTSKPKNIVSVPLPTPLNPPPATGDFIDLLALMARLRADCPWDIKQTNRSLIPYAIEEAYELAEAIQSNDDEDIKSELGDVLLQVVFHCQLYAEQGRFGISEVIETLQQKLIRRHPHVFDNHNLPDDDAVKKRWDEIKALEQAQKQARGKVVSSLDEVKAGSALMQAQSLQKQASKFGFDWGDGKVGLDDAIAKLEEEIAELKAIITKTHEKPSYTQSVELEKELGDCMFGLVNVARKLGLDAESATLTCVHKFRSRFGYIERKLMEQGTSVNEANLGQMNRLWEEAKQYE